MDVHSSKRESLWSKLRLKLFSKNRKLKNKQDLLKVMHYAHNHHVLDSESLAIIEGAIQVVDLQVRDIMIPRTSIVNVKLNCCIGEFLPQVIESAHSRFPVIDDNDEVIGILLAKDLLALILHQDNWKNLLITDILHPAVFVPESKRLNVLLRDFRANHNHMAIVVDEYGAVAGIVTIEDVLEQIVGDIADEHDIDRDNYIKVLPCGDLVVKGVTPIDFLLNELKDLKISKNDAPNNLQNVQQNDQQNEQNDKQTKKDDLQKSSKNNDESVKIIVNDWIIQLFERLPVRGEITYSGNFKIRVLSADSMRVHLIRINKLSKHRLGS